METDEDGWERAEIDPDIHFKGWKDAPSSDQDVYGRVLRWDRESGRDFNGDPCPELVVELLADTVSYRNRAGIKDLLSKGDHLQITCGLTNLRRGVEKLGPRVGDEIKIAFVDTAKSSKGSPTKIFTVDVRRAKRAELIDVSAGRDDDPAPF
jgi:hypothetical protein